jgi:hypothetical protein
MENHNEDCLCRLCIGEACVELARWTEENEAEDI